MKIGLVFPQTEFGNDPIALRDYTQTAESLGFSHILAYDHVLGANPDRLVAGMDRTPTKIHSTNCLCCSATWRRSLPN